MGISEDQKKVMKHFYDKYDELLAHECPFCGDSIVDWINKPFGGDAESWKINA